MANKSLGTRQKLSFRIEPAQRRQKPRNPVALAARQRAAGSHEKSVSARRQALQTELLALLRKSDAD